MADTAPTATPQSADSRQPSVTTSTGFAPIVAPSVQAYPAFTPPVGTRSTTTYPTTPGGSAPVAPSAVASERSGPAHALGIASLVLGVFATLGAAVPLLNVASSVFAATGVGLGAAALFQLNRNRAIALSGLIVSVVALTTAVAFVTVYAGIATSTTSSLFGELGPLPIMDDEAEEESIAASEPDRASGAFDDPVPLGETIVVTRDGEARWEITLTSATYDAEEEILRGNGASDVVADLTGDPAQYAYVSAEVTYLGDDSASLHEEVYVCFSTADEAFYCTGEIVATAPGQDLALAQEVAQGETVDGNFLVAIPAAAEIAGRWAVAGEWTDFLYVATS